MGRYKVAAGAAAVVAVTGLFFIAAPNINVENYRRPSPEIFKPPVQHATVLFGGDLMFDRSIRIAMKEKGDDHVFSCINDVLRSADLVVANLEGPITSNPSRSVGTVVGGEGNYTFTFPTSTAQLLARHNIQLVSIGNNHIMNFGREGLAETREWLDAAEVASFGDPVEHAIAYETPRGIPLAFVGYNEFESGENASTTLEQIRTAHAQQYLPVVFSHWGTEYSDISPYQRTLARSFIDAGAAIVIGSHPHIVQEHEVYSGKYIYYSLGNFLFDQYWESSVRRGLLLRVVFTPTGVSSVEEIPIDNRTDRRTCAV